MRQPINNPQLYAFEGPDGVGKSTLVAATAEILRSRGWDIEAGAFPGNQAGTLGKLVYDLHHTPDQFGVSHLLPASLQLLHVAAHLEAIHGWIARAVERGAIVLLDRIWWSTSAYGSAAGIPDPTLHAILATELLYWDRYPPCAVFLLERAQGTMTDSTSRERAALSAAYEHLVSTQSTITNVIRLQNNEAVTTVAERVATEIESISGREQN